MNSEDINTNINIFKEPYNLGQVNNVSTPMIGNNQNYQQPFIAEAPRILRHTQEFEKEVKSGCCMLIVILCIAIVIIALIVVIACVGLDCWPVIPVIVLLCSSCNNIFRELFRKCQKGRFILDKSIL